MGVIVVLELREPLDAQIIRVGEEPVDQLSVRLVHAAAADPDIPADPGPVTACGLDTASMIVEPWQPPGPGVRWYPPRWSGLICTACDGAMRSG
ncbi:hypothetical protein [Kitasatospora sp. NPDC050543]|uniref:hypothetical protein n=1 Tax=Kitasatospora sp. NPDC050543 TaxID=3364054 RepID=UPI0037AABCED